MDMSRTWHSSEKKQSAKFSPSGCDAATDVAAKPPPVPTVSQTPSAAPRPQPPDRPSAQGAVSFELHIPRLCQPACHAPDSSGYPSQTPRPRRGSRREWTAPAVRALCASHRLRGAFRGRSRGLAKTPSRQGHCQATRYTPDDEDHEQRGWITSTLRNRLWHALYSVP